VFVAFLTAAGFIVIATGVFAAFYSLDPAPGATPAPGD